jgi:phage repressor protein C with HTH and peptisase S24 domain
MNRLADNLRALLTRDGLSENGLAERTGVPQPTINRILRGDSKDPRDRTVAPLAAFWGMSVDVLKRGDALNPGAAVPVTFHAYEVEAVEADEDFDETKEAWVDSVEVEISAGNGTVVPEFVPTRSRQRYTLKWFKEMGSKPGRVKIAAVRGDSMEPTLYSTDRIAFDLDRTKIVSGRVYVISLGFESRVKRLFRMADGSIRVVSDNPDKDRYPDEHVTDETAGFKVIGQVIERKGSGGLL